MALKTKIDAQEGKNDLLITREFDLPLELLFKAYEEPELLAQWMGTKVVKLENKQHGGYLFETEQPELVFLDIQLDNDTGFNLLKLLPKRDFEVIFVTAFDNYGIQAIKFAALDYLLKPIDIDELIAAVLKAEAKLENKHQGIQLDFLINHIKKDHTAPLKIALPQQKEIRYVLVKNIIRCEADGTYTFFHLENGDKILVSKVLKEYAELLESNGFVRTHQSHLVNLAFVSSWLKEDGGVLLMQDNVKIPVSRPQREKVKAALGT